MLILSSGQGSLIISSRLFTILVWKCGLRARTPYHTPRLVWEAPGLLEVPGDNRRQSGDGVGLALSRVVEEVVEDGEGILLLLMLLLAKWVRILYLLTMVL